MSIRMGIEELDPMVQQASKKYGIPAALIHAVIQRESSGRPTVASGTGPVGLMQISKGLAKDYGYKLEDRLDPAKNIDMGARYLRDNLKAFDGDVRKALVGYSEGTGGAKQMFAGKKGFTPQALDSMNNKLFLPFFDKNTAAAQVANPVGALKAVQPVDQFDSNTLTREGAANAPTQAEIAASKAGALGGRPVEFYSDEQSTGENQKPQQNFGNAVLAAASMLAGKQPNSQTVQRAHAPTQAGSRYSPQTQAVLRRLSSIGTDIYR
ncbi:catalytic lytic transglycosylase [Escherichia phage vB_EcoP_HC-25922]|uniref:Internal core protein n=1 Tax=Escherichia phage IME267 TaxID=2860374 RepID=A0AAE8BDM8_9CAUD|nr:transglycosylase [Escherichia phage IME267]QYC96899.1 internal core protein [Escherichia phage IME267]UEN68525.1 protein inside capsid D [Escherichia phage MLP3]